jgi:hypothetical protein
MLISFKHVAHFLQIIMVLPEIKFFHRSFHSITVVRHEQIHLYKIYALLYKWTMSGSSRKGIFCCTNSNICNGKDVNPPRMVISRAVTSLVVWEKVELMQGCWDKSNSQQFLERSQMLNTHSHYSKRDMTTNSNLAVIRQDVNPPRMVISRAVTSLVVWEKVELMQGCWDKSNSQQFLERSQMLNTHSHYSKRDMTTNLNLAVIRQDKIARDWLDLTRSGTGSKCKCTIHTFCSLRQKWRKRR